MMGNATRLSRLTGMLAVGPLLITSGCGIPSMHIVPSKVPVAPGIVQVQNNIACSLAHAIDAHLGSQAIAAVSAARARSDADPHYLRLRAKYQLWRKLVEYNVQDQVGLTLTVTQTEGLNPSISFITPLTALGHSMETIVDTSNGVSTVTNATSGTYNRTLAVGFGINGTQLHNVVVNYVLDLHKMYNAIYYPQPGSEGLLDLCSKDGVAATRGDAPYGLKGELGLAEAVEAELASMDNEPYAPAITGNGSPSAATPSGSTALVTQSAGVATFSAKIDFTLGWGVNGGPNWTLLKRKGPTGGNSPVAAENRSKEDTLISTFSATCHADHNLDLTDARYFYYPDVRGQAGALDGTTGAFEIKAYLRRQPDESKTSDDKVQLPYPDTNPHFSDLVSREFFFEIIAGKNDSGLQFAYLGSGTGAVSLYYVPSSAERAQDAADLHANRASKLPRNMNGTMAVTSFITKSTTPASLAALASTAYSYSVRGAVSEGQTGAFVGSMHAGVLISKGLQRVNNLNISQNALRLLLEQTGIVPQDDATQRLLGEEDGVPKGYWASLPSCATAAPFMLSNQAVLQQLPRDVSDTLQQQ